MGFGSKGGSKGYGGGYGHSGGKGGGGGGYRGKDDYGANGGGGGFNRHEGTVEIDDRDIGRLIGKGGSNIRDLQDGTGCRIITPPRKQDGEDPGLRTVRVQGKSATEVDRCKEAISGVLMGDDPKDVLAELDGAVLFKNIDPMSMGHLAKIKAEIEDKYNVTLDLDAKTARIWSKNSDRSKALEAKEYIEEALEDLTTVDTFTVPVPPQQVNQIINDSALRQLQDQTGLTANVAKDDEGTGIRLTGLSGVIEEAKALIERLTAGEGAEYLALMPGLLTKMHPRKWQELQGDLGVLCQNSGATVELSQGSNRADFYGSVEEVSHAKFELMQILKFYFPQECDTIDIPPESVDWICGEDDRELMRLQSAGAVIAMDRAACQLWVCGNPRNVDLVRNRIRNSLARWDREHVSLSMDSKSQCFALIGTGGSTIREIQSSTGARIDCDVNNLSVMISGKEEAVAEAKRRVMEIKNRTWDREDGGGPKGGHGSGGNYGGGHYGGDNYGADRKRQQDAPSGHDGQGRGRGRGGRGGGGHGGGGRGAGDNAWGSDAGGNAWGNGAPPGNGRDYNEPPLSRVDTAATEYPASAPEPSGGASRPARGRGRGSSRW